MDPHRPSPHATCIVGLSPLQFPRGASRDGPRALARTDVPRIPDDRLDSAVYFYPTVKEARKGVQSGGTGFVFAYPFKTIPNTGVLCVITNKHVLSKAPVVRLNRIDGKPPDCIHIEDKDWFPHAGPHDLAVAIHVMDNTIHKYNAIPARICLTKALADEYKIGIGDDAYMIGRFIGHEGKVHNEPTARFGHISASTRPMFNTETGMEEDSFAVEMKSKPGYSGSPTIVYGSIFNRVFLNTRPNDKLSFEFLLGVLWGQVAEKRPLRDKQGKEIDGPHVTEFTGLSGVVPAWHLIDLMEQKNVQEAIAPIEEFERDRIANSRTVIEPMSAVPMTGPSPMPTASGSEPESEPGHRGRFKSLLGAAVKPPKSSG